MGSIVMSLFWGGAKVQRKTTADRLTIANTNVLILYLSRTKNTRALAEIIHNQVGGSLVALELENRTPPTTGLR
jgi:hypothetical protein